MAKQATSLAGILLTSTSGCGTQSPCSTMLVASCYYGIRRTAPRNPFRFGEVATGEHFTDRRAEITELSRDLRSGQSVLVMSPRRFGKTSLITAVIDKIRKQHVLVAYVELLRTTTKERFANQLAAALYAGLTPAVERAVHRAGELFQNLPLRPKITLNEDGTPS